MRPIPVVLWSAAWVALVLAISAAFGGEGEPADLKRGAEEIAAAQLKKFGSAYSARIDPARHIVYVSALDEQTFKETAALLTAFADAFRAGLGCKAPEWNVTVVLPTVDDYKPLAPAKDVTGFYRSEDRTIISIDHGRTLLHEFTHALHHADMAAARQAHPIWIVEGLASLFDASRLTAAGLEPQLDSRLLVLQKALKARSGIPLEQLVKMDQDAFMKDPQNAYCHARYLMLYLADRGLLKGWYEAYKAGFSDDPTGVRAMEKVLGKRIFDIEGDWQKWAAALKLPWGQGRADQGRLGLEFQDDSAGVTVVSLVSGGAAEQAGRLKPGDVIEKFNGQAIRCVADLVAAIRSAGAQQTVAVQVFRAGQRLTVAQPLGAPK